MSETLTLLQIQLLLYYLGAEPSKRTVTDSAKNLGITKWAVTRAMDAMEKQDIVERLENRKTVLTMTGKKLAEKYQNQMKVLEQYMQYQDIHTRQCPAGTGSGLFRRVFGTAGRTGRTDASQGAFYRPAELQRTRNL